MHAEDLFAMEAEIEYLHLVIRKIMKKYPKAKIGEKAAMRMRQKATARIEYKYKLHKEAQQH